MRCRLFISLIFMLCAVGVYSQPMAVDEVTVDEISDYVKANRPFNKDSLQALMQTTPKDSSTLALRTFDENLNEKYADDADLHYHKKGQKTTMWRSFVAALEQLMRKLFGYSPDIPIDYRVLIYNIIGAITLAVLLFLSVRLFVRHRGRWFFDKSNKNLTVDIHDTEQLLQSADFADLIAQAEQRDDTRLSIRLYYIWLLKTLRDDAVIDWMADKTNSEYLYEIADAAIRSQFSYLSYLYEHIWYGEFSISDADYLQAKRAFAAFITKGRKHG